MTTLKSRLQLSLLNRKKGRNLLEKGFTLVELMIVIVIVGILSAVALPNFLGQASKAKATECTTKIGAILSSYGADATGDETQALATAQGIAEADSLASENCTFVEPTSAAGILSMTATGAGKLADKYFAAACVNSNTGVKDIVTSTEAAPPAPTCGAAAAPAEGGA